MYQWKPTNAEATLEIHQTKESKNTENVEETRKQTDGTYQYSGFRQREDINSHAFNPYNITLDTIGDKRQVTLWYDFDLPDPDAYPTYIDVGFMTVKLNDSLVHVIQTSSLPSGTELVYEIKPLFLIDIPNNRRLIPYTGGRKTRTIPSVSI